MFVHTSAYYLIVQRNSLDRIQSARKRFNLSPEGISRNQNLGGSFRFESSSYEEHLTMEYEDHENIDVGFIYYHMVVRVDV